MNTEFGDNDSRQEVRSGQSGAKAARSPDASRMPGALAKCVVAAFLAVFLLLTARAEVPPAAVTLSDFKLVGDLSNEQAVFTLTAVAQVENSKGGSLELLSGAMALTELGAHPKWNLRAENGRYIAEFERRGKFPITLKFNAAVRQNAEWNTVDFRVAPSAVQPIELRGLAADTQFQFAGAARTERTGSNFVSHLPADGAVRLSWKEARKEAEGKLFYAGEMLAQISVSPGLMRQVAWLDFKVMQGELSRVTLLLRGAGEVTRVSGEQVLSWNVEPVSGGERRLVIQLNQPQKEAFAVQVQLQTPLGAFPQTAEVVRLQPEGATRFAGYFRIVNEGAVRLEIAQATGLSQISPEQFPETEATKNVLRAAGGQRFAYRFSSADYALRVQADQIQPELTVSEVLTYHHGQNELAIDAEFEVDVREAPLRELLLRVPRGYVIAKLSAAGMSDYFLSEPGSAENEEARQRDAGAPGELRLVYGQPVSGRQVVQLRLERNQPLSETMWALPRLEVVKAKSVRGNVGISADAGFRLSAERTVGLTEITTAFFPRKNANLQAAFRLSEPTWQATLRVERLPQTVQADGFHLFSIGEGVAYGSSVMNYTISGAPVAALRVELSDEYGNVEFTGKDVRNWQRTTNGYLVQLHAPVAGAYTLLATYERSFKPQGETLAFTGARPLDAQSESGHTLVISAYQFQVQPVEVTPGLLPLEPGEVPAEYRLFFDAPILAAYRYTTRPFNLRLALSPLAQGKSLDQVVDRASLVTRISKEGQVLTDATYFVKNRGNPHFRLTLPPGVELWAASVDGGAVVPVKDKDANLIPLPQRADPNAVLKLELKLAAKSAGAARVTVAAPIVNAPVLLAEWKLEPDAGQRLVYQSGSLTPVGGWPDVSGFAQLVRVFSGEEAGRALGLAGATLGLLLAALVVWRWAGGAGAHRFGVRHLGGFALGAVALGLALLLGGQWLGLVDEYRAMPSNDVTVLAPVQQPGSALRVEVANEAATAPAGNMISALLFGAAVVVWGLGWLAEGPGKKFGAMIAGWTLVILATLNLPNGAGWSLLAVGGFMTLHVLLPAGRGLWAVPRKAALPEEAVSLTALLVGLGWLATGFCGSVQAAEATSGPETVAQQVYVEEDFATVTAKIGWTTEKGAVLPLLSEPAVLTRFTNPKEAFKLVQVDADGKRGQQLVAQRSGTFEVEVEYQMRVTKGATENGFALAAPCGLVNQVTVTVARQDVDVLSPQAVAVQREFTGSSTVAKLVLAPVNNAWISWKPRSRDVKREKAVFYAEISQLYAPLAGVIEGAHLVAIRPAQGELNELVLAVPRGATITDVIEEAELNRPAASSNRQALVSVWRFDPDTRKLRVTLNQAQSKPFTLLVRSQVATGPLPLTQTVGLLSVENAANQLGLLGVATGNEVQLDAVTPTGLTAINLEDFPEAPAQSFGASVAGLTVRRAFRYSDGNATATLQASPVEPDVRVETQDTLSLGEDRTVLAANLTVDITRAGIFKLSFVLPPGFDVEAISGAALSHWTESKTDAGRIITLNLKGKTEGRQPFAITLAGPGAKPTRGWTVPQLTWREAGKQQGTLLVVPEQGMQLQATTLDGLSQLDPQRAGLRQKGVLAFRVLQTAWKLALDLEQVDPWIQVTSLQHATVSEAQVKVAANLQYQIENTGLKSLRVWLPTNAENVRFTGELIADFLRGAEAPTNELQQWEVKLQRRILGPYLLQVNYQTLIPPAAAETMLRGVQAADVNLQRGFVTLQSGGRVQVQPAANAALQPTEWQGIPRALQQNLPAGAAHYAFRLAEPAFQLPLKLDRHEAVKLLPARVHNVTFASVISDAGVMLTQARLDLTPGDKRLLRVKLPPGATYWFAFVNQNGVWPWREGDAILIPLEPQSRDGQPVPVELYYSSQAGQPGGRALDLELHAPKFDLPLENISWRVGLNEKWQVKHWAGTLQLAEQEVLPGAPALDLDSYIQSEVAWQREKTQEAEQMLAFGNNALAKGDPQQARRAFQSAFGLSAHDNAFNEDARVQLHNLKLQQALVGLNVRQAANNGAAGTLGVRFRDWRGAKELNYTQQDAQGIMDRNTADDNAATMRLAEKLIQQQDAAVPAAAAIRANIPQQGRVLTFQRSVAVDPEADLRVTLAASVAKTASGGARLLILAATVAVLGVFGGLAARKPSPM